MVELLEGERILRIESPHPLSFWPYYAFFLYYIIASVYVLHVKEKLIDWISSSFLAFLGNMGVEIITILIWWIILIVPAVIFSVLKISWRWLIIYTLIGVLGTYFMYRQGLSPFDLYYFTIAVAVLGIVLTDLYRRGHRYIITNIRIIAELGFLGLKVRDVFYTRITDVIMEQDILGKAFNYGSIIPITASGIGTGEDEAKVVIGSGGTSRLPTSTIGTGVAIEGGKTVTVARGRSSFILYGVPNPSEIRKIILNNIASKEPAPYLQKTVELLEKLVGEKEEKKEK